MSRRSFLLFVLVALLGALVITRLIEAPGYTDAYYHFNAATRFAGGQGLTDAYVWTYIGAPDHLPMPSHLYWMPFTSVIAAISMVLFNAAGIYAVAQLPFTLMCAGTALVGYWLGWRLGGSRRHAWVAGLLTLLNPFYLKFWGEIDTVAPYALIGSLCLIMIGIGATQMTSPEVSSEALSLSMKWRGGRGVRFGIWFIAGIFAALGHLTRADGMLLGIVAAVIIVLLKVRHVISLRRSSLSLLALIVGYGLVMLPYFARNLQEIGTPLPLGGTQAIWFDSYDDIFNYPPDSTSQVLIAGGLSAVVESRREAMINNSWTCVAVEGMIVLAPLMLLGLWKRRRDPFLLPFALYAVGLHLAMTFVFPFPGFRGGLLHSAAALIPFWAALGVVGLDDTVAWVARRRRHWNVRTAQIVFSGGLVVFAFGLSVYLGNSGRVTPQDPAIYAELRAKLPADARILSDEPAELYYYTGMGGATIPNEAPDVLLDVARRYEIDYLLLKNDPGALTIPMRPLLDAPPDFLQPIPFDSARLYAIQR